MKIAVIGGDGASHALVKKMAQSPEVSEIICFPGSDAIGMERLVSSGDPVRTIPGSRPTDAKMIADFASRSLYDLVVPRPESCLEAGVGDWCRKYGIPFAGPCSRGARLETSKAFQYQFMLDNGIPCPRGEICETVSSARTFVAKHWNWTGFAVKANGPALGKGVLLCNDPAEVYAAIDKLMVRLECGSAGHRAVIQELLRYGREVSLHIITDRKSAFCLETFRDYKREGIGDTGLNTGGIGGYSPGTDLTSYLYQKLKSELIEKWRTGCENEGIIYRGILYPGVMLIDRETDFRVFEFNARFGDPDTEVLLARFRGDLATLLYSSATDTLEHSMLSWSSEPSVGVVLCSEGYPQVPQTGREITGLEDAANVPGVEIFHNGTLKIGNKWISTGGRILTIVASGNNARGSVYEAISRIRCAGSWFRPDIAPHLT